MVWDGAIAKDVHVRLLEVAKQFFAAFGIANRTQLQSYHTLQPSLRITQADCVANQFLFFCFRFHPSPCFSAAPDLVPAALHTRIIGTLFASAHMRGTPSTVFLS